MPGPIFANVVLADEINRTPPRTQAALLEAMQERHVTVDGRTHRLARSVPRDRDAEPVRARGHLPAARVPARPLPLQDRPRLLRPAERGRDAVAAAPRHRTGHARRDPAAARRRGPRQGAAPRSTRPRRRSRSLRYIVGIVRATRELAGRPARRQLPRGDPPARRHRRRTPASRAGSSITSEDVHAIAPVRAPPPPDRLRDDRRVRAAPGASGHARRRKPSQRARRTPRRQTRRV